MKNIIHSTLLMTFIVAKFSYDTIQISIQMRKELFINEAAHEKTA
jgi:hypothetical protein